METSEGDASASQAVKVFHVSSTELIQLKLYLLFSKVFYLFSRHWSTAAGSEETSAVNSERSARGEAWTRNDKVKTVFHVVRYEARRAVGLEC